MLPCGSNDGKTCTTDWCNLSTNMALPIATLGTVIDSTSDWPIGFKFNEKICALAWYDRTASKNCKLLESRHYMLREEAHLNNNSKATRSFFEIRYYFCLANGSLNKLHLPLPPQTNVRAKRAPTTTSRVSERRVHYIVRWWVNRRRQPISFWRGPSPQKEYRAPNC